MKRMEKREREREKGRSQALTIRRFLPCDERTSNLPVIRSWKVAYEYTKTDSLSEIKTGAVSDERRPGEIR